MEILVPYITMKYTKLTDLVLIANGVITVQTVGLSKPANRVAPVILFISNINKIS
jgi:hypothetical protein